MSVSVAVVGCGYWGKNLVRDFQRLNSLGAVCDRTANARATARQLAPGVKVVSDFKLLLRDKSINAVALATPASTHCDLAIRAMRAGKDVLVEKPLALTLDDGIKMERVAKNTGRILMVGHLLEYHPAIVELRKMVEDGHLGKVNYIYSNRLNFGKIRTRENALWSFAPHDIAVILRIFNDEMPVRVICGGGSYLQKGVADVTVSLLEFRNGARAHVFVSWLNPSKEQKLVVFGDQGKAVFNDAFEREVSGATDDRRGPELLFYPQSVGLDREEPELIRGKTRKIEFSNEKPLFLECMHFLQCIRNKTTPTTNAESGLRVLRVLEACQRSLERRGTPVGLRHT